MDTCPYRFSRTTSLQMSEFVCACERLGFPSAANSTTDYKHCGQAHHCTRFETQRNQPKKKKVKKETQQRHKYYYKRARTIIMLARSNINGRTSIRWTHSNYTNSELFYTLFFLAIEWIWLFRCVRCCIYLLCDCRKTNNTQARHRTYKNYRCCVAFYSFLNVKEKRKTFFFVMRFMNENY